jgi:hypothetical protein
VRIPVKSVSGVKQTILYLIHTGNVVFKIFKSITDNISQEQYITTKTAEK